MFDANHPNPCAEDGFRPSLPHLFRSKTNGRVVLFSHEEEGVALYRRKHGCPHHWRDRR